jgi:hypothetical protein
MLRVFGAVVRWWLDRRLPSDLKGGDICIVVSGEGGFKVAKVLKADATTIHIALYKNRYSEKPAEVDTRVLTFGTIDDSGGFGIAHLPLSRATFASWSPTRIQHCAVTEEDLEGYRIWEESNGGTWS